MRDEDRTNAIGLARFAREYFDAAVALNNVQGEREIPTSPSLFLLSHAIELGVKAYLRHKGLTVTELRKPPLGHDLEQCWRRANEVGISDRVSLSDKELALLRLLNHRHVGFLDRYIVTGYTQVPNFRDAMQLAKKILDETCPSVGFK